MTPRVKITTRFKYQSISNFVKGWIGNRPSCSKELEVNPLKYFYDFAGKVTIRNRKTDRLVATIFYPTTYVYDQKYLQIVEEIVNCWNDYRTDFTIGEIKVEETAPLPMCYDKGY